jgi:Fe2+ or Zn2+ uptake regulation protein
MATLARAGVRTAASPPQPNGLEVQLRRHHRRLTPQRAIVCRLLDGNREHPSAEAIHRRASAEMPTLSLRTVYAVLHELVEIGAIRALDLGTGSARFCPNPSPHHHLVCGRCGRIRDVQFAAPPLDLPPDQRRGFWVTGVDLVFRGVCGECRR